MSIVEAWADCFDYDCPNCTAKAGEFCRNPITGLNSHAPCKDRIRLSEEQK